MKMGVPLFLEEGLRFMVKQISFEANITLAAAVKRKLLTDAVLEAMSNANNLRFDKIKKRRRRSACIRRMKVPIGKRDGRVEKAWGKRRSHLGTDGRFRDWKELLRLVDDEAKEVLHWIALD